MSKNKNTKPKKELKVFNSFQDAFPNKNNKDVDSSTEEQTYIINKDNPKQKE